MINHSPLTVINAITFFKSIDSTIFLFDLGLF